ncbi:heavy metal translocating P-type ATPase [Candidatus Symbiobacter mobilis]
MMLSAPPSATAETFATTFDLGIQGMRCASCVRRVEQSLLAVEGVQGAVVNLAAQTARVTALADTGLQERIADALRREGFKPSFALQNERKAHIRGNDGVGISSLSTIWAEWGQVALALSFALPLMLPMWASWLGWHLVLPAKWQFLLATHVQGLLGAQFYLGAWRALRRGTANMDTLVALGTTAAWALSTWLWWAEGASAHLYFESSAMVITLVLLGKALEARARRQTTSAIRALQGLRPDIAHRVGQDGEADVPVEDVRPGDTLAVRPGERFAVDGVLVEGHTQVDEAMLTGEPMPVDRGPGDAVVAGTVNGAARVLVQVQAVGADTVLAAVVRRVEDAQASKAPVEQLVDRISAVFVPIVLLLGIGTFVVGWGMGLPFDTALLRAVAVLVVACPCALGLATPAAIVVGTGVAARYGILVRDVQALEQARRCDTVVFDKTGTLTMGQARLERIDCAPEYDESSCLRWAAALQSGSEHPLARAVLDAARQRKIDIPPVHGLHAVPGKGISGAVEEHPYTLGSLAWAQEQGGSVPALAVEAALQQGHTVSVLWRNAPQGTQTLAVLAFADAVRPSAAPAVLALRSMGMQVRMVSGDHPQAVHRVASQVGIDPNATQSGALPQDKIAAVETLRQHGHGVIMVGDGINDAPALAAADVGMAIAHGHLGADVAIHASAITLLRDDLALVPAAIDIARRTTTTIRQNLWWAFVYNVVTIPLAMFGYLSPVLAGGAMALSSVSVIANALRLRRWRPPGLVPPAHSSPFHHR